MIIQFRTLRTCEEPEWESAYCIAYGLAQRTCMIEIVKECLTNDNYDLDI